MPSCRIEIRVEIVAHREITHYDSMDNPKLVTCELAIVLSIELDIH